MSELEQIKKSQIEVLQAWEEAKKDIRKLSEQQEKLANDPLFKAKQEKIDKILDTHEDNIKALNSLLDEVAKLKNSNGYTEEQKSARETSLKAAFNKFIKGGKNSSLHSDEAYKKEIEVFCKANGNISGEDAAGGYFVRPEHSNDIIRRVFESSPLRSLASSITIGSNEYIVPVDFSEPETNNRAETEAVSETEGLTFSEIKIPVHERYAYPKISTHLLDDSAIDFERYISEMVSAKFSRDEAFDFIRGNGVKRAKGILSYPNYAVAGVDEFGKLEQIATETVDSVDYAGSVELVDSLLDEFQQNAVLIMKRQTRTKYRRLVDGENHPLWEPSLQRGVPSTWLGYPIYTATHFDAVAAGGGAAGNIVAAVGDFAKGYQIVDRIGLRIIRDNITLPGYVRFIMSRRVGGGVKNFQAIKLQKLKA